MFELLERFVTRLRTVWDAMTLNQKVVSAGVFVALFISLAYLSTFKGNLFEYTVLFSQLDAQSASEIITHLEQKKIPYRLSGDGSTIEVPKERATQLKIDLTAEGLPKTGIVGYEILDTTNFGMSERIQEVKIQQALQGELSKTLMSIDIIEWANVNLSIPEPTLFTEREKPTTAAVILKFRRGGGLSQKQIEGLTYLIASSVPGLEPKNVTILDSQGNTLTKIYQDEAAMLSGTQFEFKMQLDKYLAGNAKKMLDGAFGIGKSLVMVNTELDWNRHNRTSTTYDQEKSAIVSEERTTATNPTPDGIGEEESSAINYETGQITENYVKNTGDIARLTASVFVDKRDSTWTDDNGEIQVLKAPWTDAQMASIRSITENAVSFSQERGDKIEVVQTEFGISAEQITPKERFAVRATIVEGLRAIFVGIALLAGVAVFFYLLRTITQTLDPTKITLRADKEFEKHKVVLEEEEKAAESGRDVIVRKITKAAVENPEIVAKTLKSFFKE